MTHCRSYWGGGGTTYVIRNGHFWNQTNAEYAPFISNSAPEEIPHLMNFLPASAKYDSGEGGAGKPGTTAIYGGHSHVGTMIYLGDNWPAIYRNRLFTHNLHGHQMNQQHSVRQGSAYETLHAGYDLMYAADPAYVPVDLQYGPDGAVYVIDWTDKEHCHNPRGEVWDRSNGRVYRVTWADTFRPIKVELAARSDSELVELQSHSNRWFGRTARRLLQERAANRTLDPGAVARARELLQTQDDEPLALAGLWTLHVTGNLMEEGYQQAISHRSDVVRTQAVQLATEKEQRPQLSADDLQRLAKSDPSPTVRLALAAALPKLPAEARWRVGIALAGHGEDAEDRFLPKMIWYGIAALTTTDMPRAMGLAESTPLTILADSMYWYLARHPDGRDSLVRAIATTSDGDRATRLLFLLHHGVQSESKVAMPERWREVRRRFSNSENADLVSKIDELSVLFGDEETLTNYRAILADKNASPTSRRQALRMLKRVGDREAAHVYVQLLDDKALRKDAIELVSMTSGSAVATKLLDVFPELDEAERSSALNALTSSADFASVLLQAIENNSFDKQQLSALHIRQMSNIGDEELDGRLGKMWGKITPSSADTKTTIEQLKKTYLAAPLWAFDHRRGRQVYERTCAVCHPLDGATTPLGPSLVGSWRNGVDYFVENIVDPNAVVGENFRTTVIVTDSGTIVSGMLDSESESAVVIRTAEERIVVPIDEIETRRLESQSIMPTAILETLTEVEKIELLKFLTTEPR